MVPRRPSEAERAHFRRIAASSADEAEGAPRSLVELFERLEALHRTLGRWAEPGTEGDHESELAAHIRVRQHLSMGSARGTRHG
jgi:hypothetical protein